MYCPNCGSNVGSGNFCSMCGASLNSNATNTNTTSTASNILGTVVAVSLLSGLTRQLYWHNGMYYYDPYCRRPFPMNMVMPGFRMGPRRIGGFAPPGPGPGGIRRPGPGPHGGFGGPRH